jgi:hypothetical protein
MLQLTKFKEINQSAIAKKISVIWSYGKYLDIYMNIINYYLDGSFLRT